VIVCDGFVGNVALKTGEGIGRLFRDLLRESLTRTVTAQVGAMLSRKAFNDFRRRLDYNEYGGAPLLGVRGVCIIGHGSSNEIAIFNGIRVAPWSYAKSASRHYYSVAFLPYTRSGYPIEIIRIRAVDLSGDRIQCGSCWRTYSVGSEATHISATPPGPFAQRELPGRCRRSLRRRVRPAGRRQSTRERWGSGSP
jgi:hypothetical protein